MAKGHGGLNTESGPLMRSFPEKTPPPEILALGGDAGQLGGGERARASGLFLATVGIAAGLLLVALGADRGLGGPLGPQAGGLLIALGSMGEMLAAVLGLSLTVVAIVLQLASQRYSPKIVDLFMRDRINVAMFGFMVISCVYAVLLPAFASEARLPLVASWVGIGFGVINFGLLLPYFRHVFEFLQPNNFITRIRVQAHRSLLEASGDGSMVAPRQQVAEAIERISDNCMSAISQTDRSLALHSVQTLEAFVCQYLPLKGGLGAGWREVEASRFLSLSREFHQEIVEQGTWVEARALMEYELAVRRSMGPMGEVVSQISASTRQIGISALEAGDDEALELVVRFFNTYVRHALNRRDVRALYNILYQYQLLSLRVMERRPALCQRIVGYLVYYGQSANEMEMPFATVTAAHDVRVLCEAVFLKDAEAVVPLLDLFLRLDQHAEGFDREQALIGVRKAQCILGAFFIEHGADHLAQRIRHDMGHESPQRLLRIRDGILSVEARKFWEITDRGVNFDYIEPSRRPHVKAFFDPMLGKA